MTGNFEAQISKAVEDGAVAGAAVMTVDRKGEITYSKAFGNRVLGDNTKPMGLDSVAWLASCSKISTVIATLQSVERGLLSLDEPISKVLPEWREPDIIKGFDKNDKPILEKATQRITLRQLLTHSAGMSYAGLNPTMQRYFAVSKKKIEFPGGLIKDNFVFPLLYEPGDGWEYSIGIDWAGQAVERVNGGIKLGEYFKKNIFGLLEMRDTTFRPQEDVGIKEKLLGRTFRNLDGKTVPNAPDVGLFPSDPPVDDYGGSGLYGSAEDYIKILRSLLLDDGVLLRPESTKELFSPQLKDTRYIQSVMDDPVYARVLAPSYGMGVRWDYSLGGALAIEGVEGRLSKGALHWAGLPNSYWWIDREAGVAGIYIAELYPPGDSTTQKLFAQFQREVYALATM